MAKQLSTQNRVASALPDEEHVYVSVRNTLEHARSHVERAVNSTMVKAYWEIGRQISEATGNRAEYGKHLVEYLSERLSTEYGKGYSKTKFVSNAAVLSCFSNCAHAVCTIELVSLPKADESSRPKTSRLLHARSRTRRLDRPPARSSDRDILLRAAIENR